MDLVKQQRSGASVTPAQGKEQKQDTNLASLRSARTEVAKAQNQDFQTRIEPGRAKQATETQIRNARRLNSRGETPEQRQLRKDREAQARLRNSQRERTERIAQERAQAEAQAVADGLSDERSQATAKSAKVGDRGAVTTEGVEAGRAEQASEESREASRSAGAVEKLGISAESKGTSPEGAAAAGSLGASPGAETAQVVEFKQFVYSFANRSLANTVFYQQLMNFFANLDNMDVEEREEEELLSEVETLTAGELTPEKIIRLIMIGAVCQEALKRVEERVRELGEKAPASADEIGWIMRKGVELRKKADEIQFDPRNN